MNFLKHTRTKQKSQFQKKKYIYCNLPHRSKQANQIRQKDHKNTTIKSHTAKPKNNTERKVFDTTLEGRQGRTRGRIEKVSVHQRRSGPVVLSVPATANELVLWCWKERGKESAAVNVNQIAQNNIENRFNFFAGLVVNACQCCFVCECCCQRHDLTVPNTHLCIFVNVFLEVVIVFLKVGL